MPSAADVAQRALEARALLVEQRVLGLVGGREVRVDGVELEVRAGQQLRQRAAQVVVAEAEPVHAGVDLQVVAERAAVARGRRLHARAPRRASRSSASGVQSNTPSRSLTLERAEDQDRRAHAGRAQRDAFLDVGARQQSRAGVLERERRPGRAPWPYALALTTAMTPGGVAGALAPRGSRRSLRKFDLSAREIDARDGRADHRRDDRYVGASHGSAAAAHARPARGSRTACTRG